MKHLKRLIKGFAVFATTCTVVLGGVGLCVLAPWVAIPVVVVAVSYMYGMMIE